MFDFLFKRAAKKSSTPINTSKPVESSQEQTQTAGQIALLRAGTLGNDEAAAVEFIVQCKFADARLQAAEHVHSQAMLTRVLQHVRNTDRRVAKMVQARLDGLQRQESATKEAQLCVELAQRLTQDEQFLPNQLADLDRRWQVIDMQSDQLRQQFDAVHASLRLRLETQATLQRNAIDLVINFKNILTQITAESFAQLGDSVANMVEEATRIRASQEAPSLPTSLFSEFDQLLAEFEKKSTLVAQQLLAITVRQVFLEKWEASEVASRKRSLLQSEWNALPALNECDALCVLQARFEALVQSATTVKKENPTVIHDAQEVNRIFTESLDAMEKSLEDGLLQAAIESDKLLRAIDGSAWRPNDLQAARLAKARAELSHLQGWARWGGNVSREELLKTAEELPQQSLSAIELSKKVGSLRERWKSLGVSAGQANKELWERFDAACTRAYEPAAAHFKKLAEERQQNLMKARELIEMASQFSLASNCTTEDASRVDWKGIAHFSVEMKQAWQRLGIIDRKEKKQLDAEFSHTLVPLMSALEKQRAHEVQQREKLILEATGLNPKERGVIDAVRDLQERWQASAKALPLERNAEQELWQRFKQACDQVFAQRKEGVAAADADRRQHLQVREAICVRLESAIVVTTAVSQMELSKILREARDAWEQAGQVPRSSEAEIAARYKSAVSALHQQLDAAKKIAQEGTLKTLQAKLRLCYAVENAILQQQPFDVDVRNQWQSLPAAVGAFERTLLQRFESALAALESGTDEYAAKLNSNQTLLSQELLRCEIMCGVDSPSALSKERLQLQVEVLQSALKNGQNAVTLDAQLLRICGLPAHTDDQNASRIEHLIVTIQCPI